MNKKTLTALQGSIKKWERIAAGESSDHGSANCPLCKLFFDKGCVGCPVSAKTEIDCCDGSPYEAWTDHHAEIGHDHHAGEYKVTDEASKSLAVAEVDFLRGLLPQPRGIE